MKREIQDYEVYEVYEVSSWRTFPSAVNGNTLPINNIRFKTEAKKFHSNVSSIFKIKIATFLYSLTIQLILSDVGKCFQVQFL